jgi:biopolymer transport protein TolR
MGHAAYCRAKEAPMGMLARSKTGPRSDINITPYIDILLVLLIIFMVITPVHQTDLKVRVPQPSPNPPDVTVKAGSYEIVVSVGERAQIAINRMPADINNLGIKLREIYSGRPNKNMFITASPRLPYGDVVKVIDISKGAGVADIGLMTGEIK